MQKQEILQFIQQQIANGSISASEIETLLRSSSSTNGGTSKRLSATSILYMIGAVILVLGIGSFVFRFWSDLSGSIRIAITLGLAIASYVAATLLRGDADHGNITRILFAISGILAPIGLFVTLDTLGVQYGGYGWPATVAFLLTATYGASLFFFRTAELAFFTVAFATWTIYSTTGYLMELSGNAESLSDIYKYLTIAVGAAYLLIQSVVTSSKTNEAVFVRDQQSFSNFLSSFGAAGIFGSLIALSDWSPNQSFGWEAASVLAVIGGLMLASRNGDRALLKTSALFVFILIIRFTSEYFVDSFGWPIALIIAGIALLAAGYGLVALGKKK